jgi:hypothetical protein
MPHFIKTGFWALEQKGYKGWLNLDDVMGPGGASVITVDYATLQSLITSNSLIPGSTYKITGFNKNMPNGSPENPNGYLPVVLYDDGTNSGTTIYLQAVTNNTLSESGYGEFYNPIYGDENTYDNTDGTGLYGIWDGDNPDSEDIPAYQEDQVVFWGGYAWKNLTGDVGTSIDILNLDPTNWEKLQYTDTDHYEKVIDEIKVDLSNGILIGRTNAKNQITVEFSTAYYSWEGPTSNNPISEMGWGLYKRLNNGNMYEINSVTSINSRCVTVNFKGRRFFNIDLNLSYIGENYFGRDTYFDFNTLISYSYITNNTLTNDSRIRYNTLTNNGRIENNTLISDSSIRDNTLTNDSNITNNTLTNDSRIRYNTLTNNGRIENNTLTNESSINNNTLNNNGYIINNTLTDNNEISNNTINDNSYIENNTLTIYALISSNILTLSSYVSFNEISGAEFIEGPTISAGIAGNVIQLSSISTNTISITSIPSAELPVEGVGIIFNKIYRVSQIDANVLDGAFIVYNQLDELSNIGDNDLEVDAAIFGNELNLSSQIINGAFTSFTGITVVISNASTIDLLATGALSGNGLQLITIRSTVLNEDLSSATDIFLETAKEIFTRLDGTKRLMYYNTTDTPTIVDVDA